MLYPSAMGKKFAVFPPEEIIKFDDGTFNYLSSRALSGPYSCPYGVPGDRLWVRETIIAAPPNFCGDHDCNSVDDKGNHRLVQYIATCPCRDGANEYGLARATPSMLMPRWASRISLEIIDIRAEQLNEISEADAVAEGAPEAKEDHIPLYSNRMGFEIAWNNLNAKRGFSWDSNPWVWVIEFKKVEIRD